MRTILVTGGVGFIGSHLTRRLLTDGCQVVVVDNLNDYCGRVRKLQNLNSFRNRPGFTFYKLDIGNLARLHSNLQGKTFTTIVHLAAEVGVQPSLIRPDDYVATNVAGTQNVLELAKMLKVRQFILGSSSSVYGKRSGKRGFKENDLPAPISPYAATKVAAEALSQAYAHNYHIQTTVLRFFTVYGPGNRPDMACYKFTEAIAQNKLISVYGRTTKRDFTYVDDVADGVISVLSRPMAYEVVNLGNSQPITVLKLIRLIEKQLGRKARIKFAPLPEGDMPATFANVTKAKKLFNWQPKTQLEMGVKNLVDWYKQSHGL